MATFNVSADRLLNLIEQGIKNVDKELAKRKLYYLQATVREFQQGYKSRGTGEVTQYDWDGEVTLESYNLKLEEDSLPQAFRVRFEEFLLDTLGYLFKDMQLLQKYKKIIEYASSDITMDDKEFSDILDASRTS